MSFIKFPELPAELQIRIFEYALPNPRIVDGVILVIVGRNLNKARAILPNLREFKGAYSETQADSDFHVDDDGPSNELWDPANKRMLKSRRPVFNILHTCRIAREAALGIYRLDMHSIIPEENIPWWDPDLDNLYFQPPYSEPDSALAVLQWLAGDDRHSPKTRAYFPQIQHVTLCVDRLFTVDFGLTGTRGLTREYGGLLSSPTLESLNLLLDPGKNSMSHCGKILYYEPEDVPVSVCGGKRLAEIEEHVKSILQRVGPTNRETPDVNIFIMGVRAKKQRVDRKGMFPFYDI